MSKIIAVNETQFNKLVALEGLVVVADFTATWCGPCRLVAPIMERLAEEYWKRAAVAKVDVEINQAIAKRYEIRSIPAVLILKGGEVVERAMGKQSYEFYKELIDKHL